MDYRKVAEDFIRYRMPHGHGHPTLTKYQMFNKGERFALFFLMHNKGNATPGEIAEATRISTARVTALLNRLEERGYVLREMDPNDRRKIVVSLTEAGREVITREQKELVLILAAVFKRMGERDTMEFLRLFGDFNTYMAECFPDCMAGCVEHDHRHDVFHGGRKRAPDHQHGAPPPQEMGKAGRAQRVPDDPPPRK
jgi:DNA-binding MarR family transcriptional regulator